jgi:hypothetical protein
MRFPSTQKGATNEQLGKIYNVMDVYVQYSVAEGAGMPAIEAASCGIPVMETDYSAMEDYVRCLQGSPIPIKKAFREDIKEMQGLVSRMSASIANLMSQISSAQSAASAAKAAAAGIPSKKPKLATGGLVTGPTNALIGEAGPELVIPLDKFESWMNMGMGGNGKAINYYAAPNQSLDNEQELFQAMKRAKVVVGW